MIEPLTKPGQVSVFLPVFYVSLLSGIYWKGVSQGGNVEDLKERAFLTEVAFKNGVMK